MQPISILMRSKFFDARPGFARGEWVAVTHKSPRREPGDCDAADRLAILRRKAALTFGRLARAIPFSFAVPGLAPRGFYQSPSARIQGQATAFSSAVPGLAPRGFYPPSARIRVEATAFSP